MCFHRSILTFGILAALFSSSCLKSSASRKVLEPEVLEPIENKDKTETAVEAAAPAPQKVESDVTKACLNSAADSAVVHSFTVLRRVLQVADCSGLTTLTGAEGLDLSGQDLKSLAVLSFFPQLKYLDISKNRQLPLAELALLKNLQGLRLEDADLTSLEALPALPQLRSLSLAANKLQGRIELSAYPLLEELDLSAVGALDELVLARPGTLRILRINQTPLKKLSDLLLGTLGLQELYIRAADLKDAEAFKPLLAIKQFDFRDNQIADLSPLSTLTNISHVWADHNQIVDLRPLASLPRLEVLHLAGNLITDRSPLDGLAALWDLNLSDNPLTSPTK